MKFTFKASLAAVACLVATAMVAGQVTSKMMIAPAPIALRVARADVVITGKVTKIEDKTVSAAQFPGSPNKAEYQIAVVKIQDPILNAKGITEIRIGFVPPAPAGGGPRVIRPGGMRAVTLKEDQEGLFFLTKHFEGDFYTIPAYFDFVDKAIDNNGKVIDESKKAAKLLSDPMVGLKSKDADDRFLTAAMLVEQFRTIKQPTDKEPKEVPIDAAESKLILTAINDADWAPQAKPGMGMVLSPQMVFSRLGLTPEDNWTPPVAGGDYVAAAQQWLKDNAATYRIKKFVPEKKVEGKKDAEKKDK